MGRRGGRARVAAVHGDADEGYGAVADAFRRNFRVRHEIGAACAVMRDGRLVVDLWGGHRDEACTHPWERDTLVPVFSTTKGMAATAMAVAHSRGLLALDEPVATYWPAFAQRGKHGITVRQLLTHRGAVAAISVPLDLETLADADRLGEVLAAQAPNWPIGDRHGYHGQSLGLYESQLLRRVDPQHRSIGRFFADEVATALGVEFHIGLPDGVGDERLATFTGGRAADAILHLHEMPVLLALALANPRSLTGRVFRNPRALRASGDINRRELLQIELPSVNGVGTARAIATVYGALAAGGSRLGLGAPTVNELEAAVPGRWDLVLKARTAFALGFMKPVAGVPFGSSGRAYGHGGVGGSFGYADPDRGLGYAYVMNRGGFSDPFDPRDVALRTALDTVLS